MNKSNCLIFTLLTIIFSEDQLLWDLGVKINKAEKIQLINAEERKKTTDDSLFNEVVGLSNKLKISQKIDQEVAAILGI